MSDKLLEAYETLIKFVKDKHIQDDETPYFLDQLYHYYGELIYNNKLGAKAAAIFKASKVAHPPSGVPTNEAILDEELTEIFKANNAKDED